MLSMLIMMTSAQALNSPQAVPQTYDYVMSLPVPVTEGDITDRPYCIVEQLKKEVRKATLFSKAPSLEKSRREIWEDAQKRRADAVINFTAGESRITGISWGAKPVRGTAIRFAKDGICPTGTAAPTLQSR